VVELVSQRNAHRAQKERDAMPKPTDIPANTPAAATTAATDADARAHQAASPLPARSAHTIPEGSLLLGGVSPATIYRWHAKGLIKLVKIGGRRLIPASEIARLSGGAAA
jgi:hypothetical protein